MKDVLATAARWRAEGVGFGRATLVRSVGSAPFEVGSTLLAADDGRLAGSVSAGCVEGAASEAVLAARRGGYRELVHYGVTDELALEVGLTCGGEIDVLVEPEVPDAVLDVAGEGRALAIATPLPSGRAPAGVDRVVLDAGGIRSGSLGDVAADAELATLARDALGAGISRTVRVGGARRLRRDARRGPPRHRGSRRDRRLPGAPRPCRRVPHRGRRRAARLPDP